MGSPVHTRVEMKEACQSEEEEAKRWMDRASRYLMEGRYESAIRLLEKTENVFPDCKNLPELMAVTQVCYASTWRACHCGRPYARKLPDWYRVLKVEENADFDTIKKRYRQLALLLHPDKNKHVNSEGAFKLISEAYACLSDKLKRDAFNLERRRSHCSNCSLKVQVHAAGHAVRPSAEVQKPNPVHHSNTFNGSRSWVNETDNFQNLRERAKARVDSLEREWGSKRSKWIQQLATVRQRYKGNRTYESPTPTPVKSHAGTRRDSLSPFRCHEESKPREAQFARSQSNCGPNVGSGPELNTGVGQERRSSTSDANGERATNIEENLDSLLRRLKAENTSTSREYSMLRDFGVHISTPEAEHMLRPLNGRRMARSSSLDRRWSKADAGQGFSCIPKGRCLSKKVYSPVAAVNLSTTYSDRGNRKVSTSDGKSHSFPKGDISFRGVERTKSASELGKMYHPTVSKEEHLGGPTISKTVSGTWTERVQVHSKMFDEFVTSVFPSTAQTPIHSQSASSEKASTVFRVPMGSTIDGSKGSSTVPSSKPSLDQEQKKIQRESSFPSERKVPSSGRERSTVPILKDGSDGRSLHQIRLPLGTRSENVASYSNNLNQGSNVFKGCKIDKQKEAHLEHVEDLQQKQKSDALNGILERLRAEAKTVAATLDRLRENFSIENTAVVH